ncbi:MarR family winged helix-turn-helix transcriptional regulator [Klenkia taihuensis]|uniref:DNA-binding transcriptional regulator, MarR family n=1 Tax=Klenkia taihuensis TaxID=1225127 RepID=A0A1I1P617_9ACTN|nr:MarR family transcriptional regulator [Klenkia taihuensis]GHE11680.1 MarR family transcriptional regulator [Klenkia taihuensis]SFD01420.1 DNA-binding transcriptional regulator, MarR family [Klenkia taihuensis]
MAEDDVRWLTAEEDAAWTGLVSLVLLLPGRLESDLQRAAGVTLFEYLTLSHVSEAPDRRLRMGELAYLASGSPSRLSNVVKRLEGRGLLRRYPDPDDGRRTVVELTDPGWDLVVVAAPPHLRSVRARVLDHLDPADLAALTAIAGKLGAH